MKKSAKFHQHRHTMYGTTVLGARGQLVIPAEARKDLKLKPGDRLVIMGQFDKVLGLIKADELSEFVELIMERINSKNISREMKREALKALSEMKQAQRKD